MYSFGYAVVGCVFGIVMLFPFCAVYLNLFCCCLTSVYPPVCLSVCSITMWEILTREEPFNGISQALVVSRVVEQDARPDVRIA